MAHQAGTESAPATSSPDLPQSNGKSAHSDSLGNGPPVPQIAEPVPAGPVPVAVSEPERKVDPVLQLAFDSAKQRLTQQDTTLTALRNRATGLLAASSVGTSVAAAVGLLNLDPTRGRVYPLWAGWSIVGLVLAIGLCVVVVIWPAQKWAYGVDPGRVLKDVGKPADEVFKNVTLALTHVASRNAVLVKLRQRFFEAGALGLVLQTALVALSLSLGARA